MFIHLFSVFPVVQIVTFDNGPCQTTSGDTGACYSQKECGNLGGSASGTCANGFGVCCVSKYFLSFFNY